MLDECPEIKEKLHKKRDSFLIDAYEALLPTYNMSFHAYPVYKNDYNDNIAYFTYQYTIDKEKHDELYSDRRYKTLAKAQLEAVHATMYKLRERIKVQG